MSMRFEIGPFPFISLSRAISRPFEQIEREVRPGIAGTSFWRTGQRGEPFALRSVVDCPDVPSALTTLAAYERLVGQDPVGVTWADVALAGLLVMVLGVMPDEGGVHTVLQGVGGLLGSSNALLRAVWLVEPINPFARQLAQS